MPLLPGRAASVVAVARRPCADVPGRGGPSARGGLGAFPRQAGGRRRAGPSPPGGGPSRPLSVGGGRGSAPLFLEAAKGSRGPPGRVPFSACGASDAHPWGALALNPPLSPSPPTVAHQEGLCAPSYDPPPRHRYRSLAPGGYGPVSPGGSCCYDGNGVGVGNGHLHHLPAPKDAKGRKLHSRLIASASSFLRRWGCSSRGAASDEGPSGRYYRDDFNDQPRTWNPGTGEENGIWMNTGDQAGTVMALTVWFLLGYSAVTVSLLAQTGGIPAGPAMAYDVLCALALACHAKTTFTDPGSVPQSAVPSEGMRNARRNNARGGSDGSEQGGQQLSMCSQCQTFKPPFSHHCRICNRCISRMDHHCPWMNNCIGAGNLKHFVLFLSYTWLCSASSLLLLGWNYFFCADEECTFTPVLIQLVRIMTVLSVGSFLFTSSMIMNVAYGLLTGIGTIDRLKKKATNTMHESTEMPIPLRDVFGVGGYHTWPLPVDPVFEDYDRVMGYSTPQRLLREQMKEDPDSPLGGGDTPGGRSAAGGGECAHSVISRASFLPPASEQSYYGPV